MIEHRHDVLEQGMKTETDKLLELLQSNTSLTQQDKELTDEVARLTREIHTLLTEQREAT
jgi:hypothetical protein